MNVEGLRRREDISLSYSTYAQAVINRTGEKVRLPRHLYLLLCDLSYFVHIALKFGNALFKERRFCCNGRGGSV